MFQGCRGEFMEQINKAKWHHVSKCRLAHHQDPYLQLGPFKLEVSIELPDTQ